MPCGDAAKRWSWPPRRTGAWVTTPTRAATPAAGSSGKWTTACGAYRPTTSTCTRCTVPIRRPISTRTLSALSDLIRSGKVRAVGSSTFPAEQIVEAQWVAERRGHERFRCEQPPYSIFARGVEAAVLPTCAGYGMGVITWSPLAGGWLSGKYRKESDIDLTSGRAQRIPGRFDPSVPGNARKLQIVEELVKIAADAGIPLTHLAIAFTIAHPAVTAAIIGPRTMDQLKDLLGGADVALDDAVLDRIDQIVAPGVTLNDADAGWQPPSLTDPNRRRRPISERTAA